MELYRYPIDDKNIFWKCRKGCKNKNERINKIFLGDFKNLRTKEYWLNCYIPNIDENETQFKKWVLEVVDVKFNNISTT